MSTTPIVKCMQHTCTQKLHIDEHCVLYHTQELFLFNAVQRHMMPPSLASTSMSYVTSITRSSIVPSIANTSAAATGRPSQKIVDVTFILQLNIHVKQLRKYSQSTAFCALTGILYSIGMGDKHRNAVVHPERNENGPFSNVISNEDINQIKNKLKSATTCYSSRAFM